jgi:hypothetical protein
MQAVKWWTRVRLVAARRKLIMARAPWVMGRIACLGFDVHKLLGARLPLVNTQKGRIDLLLSCRDDRRIRSNTSAVAPFFLRKDVLPLVAQQEAFVWPSAHPPVALFMDSYSELTDQLFTEHRTRRSFCANYSDVEHTEAFSRRYDCHGLLKQEDIEACYRAFFSAVRTDLGRIPIVYLHFPIELEQRQKFRIRHGAIVDAINAVAADFAPFHSIAVDPGLARWPDTPISEGMDAFPYHYHSSTYANLAVKVGGLNIPL